MTTETHSALLRRRLAAQQLVRPRFGTPHDVVRWLGAVQAQDYSGAKWAIALRLPGSFADEQLEDAIARGTVVRTHAMRFTWQLVAPEDVRWILSVTAPALVARSGRRNQQLDLDAATFRKSNAAIEKALARGGALTRDEIAAALGDAGVSTDGQRLAHILGHAELAALICGGPRRDKQFTYVLLDAHAPSRTAGATHDEALAELARRYFQSRGPATLADFKWWSGLPAADARTALESIDSTLAHEEVSGRTYFRAAGAPPRVGSRSTAILLPPFDEYVLAYQERDAMFPARHAKRINAGGGVLGPCVVVDGRVVGTWSRAIARAKVLVQIRLFERVSSSARAAIEAAADRYGAFLGVPAVIASLTTA